MCLPDGVNAHMEQSPENACHPVPRATAPEEAASAEATSPPALVLGREPQAGVSVRSRKRWGHHRDGVSSLGLGTDRAQGKHNLMHMNRLCFT